jgi:hypothetical protein
MESNSQPCYGWRLALQKLTSGNQTPSSDGSSALLYKKEPQGIEPQPQAPKWYRVRAEGGQLRLSYYLF